MVGVSGLHYYEEMTKISNLKGKNFKSKWFGAVVRQEIMVGVGHWPRSGAFLMVARK